MRSNPLSPVQTYAATRFLLPPINNQPCCALCSLKCIYCAPPLVQLPGKQFSCAHPQVAWDPLDGSSILAAGWAVGAIFGVWPGGQLLGRRGEEQAAAAYAVFGPRTILIVARPRSGSRPPADVFQLSTVVLSVRLWNCLEDMRSGCECGVGMARPDPAYPALRPLDMSLLQSYLQRSRLTRLSRT